MSESAYDRIQRALDSILPRVGQPMPTVGFILGSGLGSYADHLENSVAIDYSEIPGFPSSTVAGHPGRLVVGQRCGVRCVAMQGRVHYYEGLAMAEVTLPARVMVALGASTLVITNAAGGLIHEPGTLMLIRDHINLIPDNPLRGPNDDRLGARFVDMTRAYCPELRKLARMAAERIDVELAEGVYAAVPGPSYETPAEIRMLGRMGADAAGMSTVPEVIVANHMGARVLGISCITNEAAGLSGQPLSHEEVTETANHTKSTFQSLLDEILTVMKEQSGG